MVTVVNNFELEKRVQEYLAGPSFEKPMAIIGFTGIGKTAIVKKAVDEPGKTLRTLSKGFLAQFGIPNVNSGTVFLYQIFADKILVDDNDKADLGYLMQCELPVFLEITVEYEGQVRDFYRRFKKAFNWYAYRLPPEDFLAWSKDHFVPMFQDFLEFAPSVVSPKYNEFSKAQEQVKALKEGTLTALDEERYEEAFNSFKDAVHILAAISLSSQEMSELTGPILDKLGPMMKLFPPQLMRQCMSFVMGEVLGLLND